MWGRRSRARRCPRCRSHMMMPAGGGFVQRCCVITHHLGDFPTKLVVYQIIIPNTSLHTCTINKYVKLLTFLSFFFAGKKPLPPIATVTASLCMPGCCCGRWSRSTPRRPRAPSALRGGSPPSGSTSTCPDCRRSRSGSSTPASINQMTILMMMGRNFTDATRAFLYGAAVINGP